MANTSTLIDNFNDNSFNTTLWGRTSATYVKEQNNELELFSRKTANYDYCYSVDFYAFDYASIELIDVGNTSIASYEAYPLQIYDGSSSYQIYIIGSDISFLKKSGGDTSQTETYSPTEHRYLRIRIDGSNAVFEKSANGISWTAVLTTAAFASSGSVTVMFTVGTWQAEASTTTMKIDNFNVLPSVSTKRLLGLTGVGK